MAEFNDSPASNVVVVDFDRAPLKKSPQGAEMSSVNDDKRQLFQEYLKKGVVSVLLDATAAGVKVPLDYAKERNLILNFAYDFHVPDFNFNDVGIWATLSFSSGEHFCMVPWDSVLGMYCETLAHNFDNKATVIEFDFSNNKPA